MDNKNNSSREKQLIKNTGILAIGTICSKFISFFLLPLYTAVLSREDYGTVDVLQSVSSFILPLVTMELSTGAFRFLIEKNKDNHEKIISSAFFIELLNIVFFTIIVNVVNRIYAIPYCGLFIFYFSSFALLQLTQNITRGFGNNALYSVMSFMVTAISLSSNLILILLLGRKGDSILLSAGIAYFITSVFCVIRQSLWKYVKFKAFSKDLLKEILKYCLPMIPNAVSWWVANTSDRLVILYFMGANNNGIYAAANKVPSIYVTIYGVYNIAWIEALARGVSDPGQVSFINDVFWKSIRLFGCVSIGLISCVSIVFRIMIGANYADAYWHIFILIVAIFINSLCSLLGGIFTAFKRSDIIGRTTVIGALTNLIVHLLLVKFIGLFAASISTLVSYYVIMLCRNWEVKKLISLEWPKRYLVQFLVALVIVGVGYYLKNTLINIIILICIMAWSVYVNQAVLKQVGSSVIKKISGMIHKK